MGVFGIGNIYAGHVGRGIALLLSYWLLFWSNVGLVFLFGLGFFTGFLSWIAYMVAASLLAAKAVDRHNSRALGRSPY